MSEQRPPPDVARMDLLIEAIRQGRGRDEKMERAWFAVRDSGYLVVARLEAYFEQDRSLLEDYQTALEVFFTWLDQAGSGGSPAEIEVRGKAAGDFWTAKHMLSVGHAVASAILELPPGHPLRSEDFARQLLDAAMRDAAERQDAYGVVRCITATLRYNLTDLEDALSLTRAGLGMLELVTPITARNFRLAVGQYMGLKANIHPAAPDKDGALALQTGIDVVWPLLGQQFEPVLHNDHLLMAGDLLGRAGRLSEAADCFHQIVASTHPDDEQWWRASVLEGQYRAELGEYDESRRVLRPVLPQLLDRYVTEADARAALPNGMRGVAPSLHVSDAASALAVAEAGCGAWNAAFSALDTAMALDYRYAHRSSAGPSRTALSPASVADVSSALLPDEALLVLGVDDSTMAMLVVPGDTDEPTLRFFWPGWSHIGWQRLLGLTNPGGWLTALLGPPGSLAREQSLDSLVRSLDPTIGAPVAEALRVRGLRHITVVAHRSIGLVPMWALPSLDEFAVSIASSPSLFATHPRARTVAASALVATDPTGDLPGARAEAVAVAARLGTSGGVDVEVLTGRGCTPQGLAAAGPVGVFHFGGHAELDMLGLAGVVEDRSGLIVAGEDGAPRRGSGADLAATPVARSGLLVLSACRSGVPSYGIDEVHAFRGLPAWALAGGAGAVIATLWPITDVLGTVFADVFFRRLASAMPQVDVPAVLRATTAELANLDVGAVQHQLARLQEAVDDPVGHERLGAYIAALSSAAGYPFRARAQWGAFFTLGTRMLTFAT